MGEFIIHHLRLSNILRKREKKMVTLPTIDNLAQKKKQNKKK